MNHNGVGRYSLTVGWVWEGGGVEQGRQFSPLSPSRTGNLYNRKGLVMLSMWRRPKYEESVTIKHFSIGDILHIVNSYNRELAILKD